MAENRTLVGHSYYDHSNFHNTYLNTILTLYTFFESFLFPNDSQRIIYSSNDFAFRKRLQTQSLDDISNFQANSLNFPFMNFYMTDVSSNTDRTLKNNALEISGVMNYDIGKKIKLSPVKLDFEATFFSNEEKDIQYVMSEILWSDALETLLYPTYTIDGETFQSYISLGYTNAGYRPQYTQNDFLTQNRIRTVTLDFSVDTFLIKTNTEGFAIPQEVLFSFAMKQNLENIDFDDYDSLLTGVINHIEESVVFS